MTAKLKQDEPDTRNILDTMKQGVIGKPIPRVEGLAKVTGTATYAAEYKIDGCLEGVMIQAPFAKGTVTAIDTDALLAMPGVVAVIEDPRQTARAAQGTANEAPVQEPMTVTYYGQPVALVVAETFEDARNAAAQAKLTYDIEQVGSFDPQDVEAEVQEDSATRQGDLAHAVKTAAHAIDTTIHTEGHASAAMEPHGSIAEWDGRNLTVYASLQMLNYNITELADSLDLEEDRVRLVSRYVGGGFGSKLGVSEDVVAASLAAMQLNRPVRVVMTRQQVFQTVMRRSESAQRFRFAADSEGTLSGFGHEARVSNLPQESFAEPVLQSSDFLYKGENRLLELEVARIHRMTAGSVRAPGEAIGMPALEIAMDMLAEKAGVDPVELRIRNIPDKHPANGKPFSSHKLEEALRQGAEAFGWDGANRAPRQTRDGEWWIGTGMASAARVHNVSKAQVRVVLAADGTARVETDMTDIGTGTYTILAQVVGEMLGLETDKVLVSLGDTAFPRGSGSGGSWGAASVGSAAFVACNAVRDALCEKAGINTDDAEFKDGRLNGGKTFSDILDGTEIDRTGEYEPGDISEDYVASGFGAFFAEVRVNRFTGETRVTRMLGAFGFGRVLNEKTARSQCLGGITWSIGAALTEALLFDPKDGHVVNQDLAEYHVPVCRDVPDCEVIMVDERDPAASPIQAKGIGELGMCGGAGAIANAIYNACGARVLTLPMTPDRVIAAMPD